MGNRRLAVPPRSWPSRPRVEFSDLAPLVAGKHGREAEAKDDPDSGIWTAGQVVGLIEDRAGRVWRVPREPTSLATRLRSV